MSFIIGGIERGEGFYEKINERRKSMSDEMVGCGKNEVLPEVDTKFVKLKFQQGPISEGGVNGCQIEDVLDILIRRLSGFQLGKFPCNENRIALEHMETALLWLKFRTSKRISQNVEGKNVAHIS
jgi:hypothetical protein